MRRRWAALETRSTGGYVSWRRPRQSARPAKPIRAVRCSVQRQPRAARPSTRKAPAIGPNSGPLKTAIEKSATAEARVWGANISANTAPTTAIGQLANTPPKKRATSTVCMSLAAATATWNTEKPNMPSSSGIRRPLSSENGAPASVSIACVAWWGETDTRAGQRQSRARRATCRAGIPRPRRKSGR